jgi:RNA polymerase sigma-70 factor, ECF subfamily
MEIKGVLRLSSILDWPLEGIGEAMISLVEKETRFEDLASPLVDELTAAARHLTHDPGAAEDLVQETLLKAYRAYGRFAAGTNFRAWLHRILYNTFVSDFRRRRDRHEQTLPETMDAPDTRNGHGNDTTSKDLDAIGETLDENLKRALGKLNPEFRDVFIRAAIDEASSEEIAKELKIPVGTVMSRMHRARLFLREELAAN